MPPIVSTSRRMTPVSRSTAMRDVEVGPVAGELGRPRVVALEEDRLAARTDVRAGDDAAAGRQHVLAVAGRMDERVGQRLERERGERLVDLREAREVRVGEAARAVADRALGPEAVDAGVGPDEIAVGDPDLVVARRRSRRRGWS